MPRETFGLSIVLPAYNEEVAIERTVTAIADYVRQRGLDAELLVVDDGSTDATPARLAALRARAPFLRVLRHAENRGYGEALRTGFSTTGKDWIFLMDADGQFDVRELDRFLPYTGAADLLIGYRTNRADPPLRALLTRLYAALIRRLVGLPVRDPGCAFKLFRREAWTRVQPVRSTDHKVFTVEWLRNALRAGFRVQEIPVRHYPRVGGRPTGARPDVIWQTLRALLALRREAPT